MKILDLILDEMFDSSVSPSTITELTKTFAQFRQAWENSQLEKHYLAVFCDVVFVTVKRGDSYSKEGIFIAIGVREDFKRELLKSSNFTLKLCIHGN